MMRRAPADTPARTTGRGPARSGSRCGPGRRWGPSRTGAHTSTVELGRTRRLCRRSRDSHRRSRIDTLDRGPRPCRNFPSPHSRAVRRRMTAAGIRRSTRRPCGRMSARRVRTRRRTMVCTTLRRVGPSCTRPPTRSPVVRAWRMIWACIESRLATRRNRTWRGRAARIRRRNRAGTSRRARASPGRFPCAHGRGGDGLRTPGAGTRALGACLYHSASST